MRVTRRQPSPDPDRNPFVEMDTFGQRSGPPVADEESVRQLALASDSQYRGGRWQIPERQGRGGRGGRGRGRAFRGRPVSLDLGRGGMPSRGGFGSQGSQINLTYDNPPPGGFGTQSIPHSAGYPPISTRPHPMRPPGVHRFPAAHEPSLSYPRGTFGGWPVLTSPTYPSGVYGVPGAQPGPAFPPGAYGFGGYPLIQHYHPTAAPGAGGRPPMPAEHRVSSHAVAIREPARAAPGLDPSVTGFVPATSATSRATQQPPFESSEGQG